MKGRRSGRLRLVDPFSEWCSFDGGRAEGWVSGNITNWCSPCRMYKRQAYLCHYRSLLHLTVRSRHCAQPCSECESGSRICNRGWKQKLSEERRQDLLKRTCKVQGRYYCPWKYNMDEWRRRRRRRWEDALGRKTVFKARLGWWKRSKHWLGSPYQLTTEELQVKDEQTFGRDLRIEQPRRNELEDSIRALRCSKGFLQSFGQSKDANAWDDITSSFASTDLTSLLRQAIHLTVTHVDQSNWTAYSSCWTSSRSLITRWLFSCFPHIHITMEGVFLRCS